MPFLKIMKNLADECQEIESIILCDEEGERVYSYFNMNERRKSIIRHGQFEDLEYQIDVEGAVFAVFVENAFSTLGESLNTLHLVEKTYCIQILKYGYYILYRVSRDHRYVFASRPLLFENVMIKMNAAL